MTFVTHAPATSRLKWRPDFPGNANVPGVFRIDHDQAYQQTVNLRYQRGKDGVWADFIWRYDSGLVVTGVPNGNSALLLTRINKLISACPAVAFLRPPQAPCAVAPAALSPPRS